MKLSNRTSIFILFSVVILLGAGIKAFIENQNENPADKPESEYQRWSRQMKQADAALASAITNDVVGYTRTIEKFCATSDNDIKKWWASATVEFVNRNGGVDRTNLYWMFSAYDRNVYAHVTTSEEALRKK